MVIAIRILKKMLRIYYKICVDTIVKSKITNDGIWKFNTIMFMSAFLSLIFMSIIFILKRFFPEYLNFSIFSDNYIEKSLYIKLEAVIFYLIPSFVVNYYLIIYNKRYEKLLLDYKPNKGRYMLRFMVFSLVLIVVSIFV
ncbi:MAG: hypothetical protein RLZZ540_2154 [Bacteroidota bacterium]|jgi:hypothetical protein